MGLTELVLRKALVVCTWRRKSGGEEEVNEEKGEEKGCDLNFYQLTGYTL